MSYKLMLKPIRKARHLTQGDLAKLVGVSERKLASWERGETNILLEDAYRCAIALGCDVNDLCGWPTGKNAGKVFSDGFEQELIECYRSSTIEQRDLILMSARNAAGMSKDAAKHSASEPKLDEAI